MMLIAERQSNEPLKLIQRVRDFSLQIDAAVQRKTDAWVAEFQRNIINRIISGITTALISKKAVCF
ncbi:hypothetical protein [Desulfonema magnum]|uniref:Uncharacterized protein n=1 Tax=Desulfonema magnum TaxID=45655 RepID=A0A975GM68_9BACT|nr:hypothetical protein [Desulfonema magnum]QTA86591.1 Uncharacterized protein dnm_026150 [Desulfonema magnum]